MRPAAQDWIRRCSSILICLYRAVLAATFLEARSENLIFLLAHTELNLFTHCLLLPASVEVNSTISGFGFELRENEHSSPAGRANPRHTLDWPAFSTGGQAGGLLVLAQVEGDLGKTYRHGNPDLFAILLRAMCVVMLNHGLFPTQLAPYTILQSII